MKTYQVYSSGGDVYRDIRPDINHCIDSDPAWAGKVGAGDRHAVLLHAAMVSMFIHSKTHDELGNKIAAYCERWGVTFSPTWFPQADHVCAFCGGAMRYEFGRPARFCSDACKMKAYRKRKALRKSG